MDFSYLRECASSTSSRISFIEPLFVEVCEEQDVPVEIGKEAWPLTLAVLDVAYENGVSFDGPKLKALVSHMIASTGRIVRGERLEPLDSAIEKEVGENLIDQVLKVVGDRYRGLGSDAARAEAILIATHIAAAKVR